MFSFFMQKVNQGKTDCNFLLPFEKLGLLYTVSPLLSSFRPFQAVSVATLHQFVRERCDKFCIIGNKNDKKDPRRLAGIKKQDQGNVGTIRLA